MCVRVCMKEDIEYILYYSNLGTSILLVFCSCECMAAFICVHTFYVVFPVYGNNNSTDMFCGDVCCVPLPFFMSSILIDFAV